jgi:hypothetical protein
MRHPCWVTGSALLTRPSGLVVPPRFITPYDPGRPTLGPAVAKVHEALGRPMMPWQRLTADVGSQVDDVGRFIWQLIIVSVPRQSGKTTTMLAKSIQRCLMAPHRKSWNTAQTGQDARKKWRENADEVMASPLAQLVAGKPAKSNGAEALTFINGSKFRPFPPTRDALHGEQSDNVDADEVWAYDEQQGDDLLQAVVPTQLTRPGAQLWLWSTRGDRHSVWFHNLIEQAMAGQPGVLLIDYGIPDDADPMDLDVVAAHHPALGHTVTMDSLRAAQTQLADKPSEFARAYGNRATGAGERVIPRADWEAVVTTDDLPEGRPAYAIATSADGSMTAVVAAVVGPDGTPWVEVLPGAHRPGRSWAVDYVRNLADAGQGVAVDRTGPAGPIADQLELAGVQLLTVGGTDHAAACADLYDRITDPGDKRVRLRAHPGLDDAADVATRRFRSDGAWVWSRVRSGGDISPLEAAGLGVWAVLRNPAAIPAPFVVFG